MSSIILQAHSLTKKYRHTVALDHIDLQIEKGKIYGFIGQNGAGKTTFLRLVTGLAFPTSGTLGLWGKSSAKDLQEQRKRIGCMIETPALGKALRLCPSLVSTGAFLFREKDFEHGGGWLWLRQSSKRKGRSPLI